MKESINLLRGWPSASLLPAAALRAASQTALSDPAIWMPGLEYGPDMGYQPLREAVARWLGRFYAPAQGGGADTDRITITGGASQNLACVLQSFTDPAQTLAVWMVAPTYHLATPIFGDAGLGKRLHAVPEDEEGVDVGYLERSMRVVEDACGRTPVFKDAGPHRKIYRHVVYCVPTFGNPSGRTMTLARRERLVRVAREHDALVICDDVYDMLQWSVSKEKEGEEKADSKLDTALLPRLVDIDMAQGASPHDPAGKTFGHTVSNGSFSKLVAPGTRTGWTYSSADFARGLSSTGSTQSGGAPSQLTATIVCELLLRGEDEEGGLCRLDTHIRQTLRPSYARRHGVLVRAVRDVLVPLGVRLQDGSLRGQEDVYGGYFIWLMLPRQSWPTAQAIADRCRADEDLIIGNGEMFSVCEDGDEEVLRFSDAIRLCFAWEDEEDLVDGVKRLGRVIKKMLDEGPHGWEVIRKESYDLDRVK
ncbi:PLP-dependent transferase [Xylaria nigripes]|nr:PLP-dependent transferase [Xylaria nigripes]